MSDRGQSEVLGFAIIFGIMVTGVALVMVTGMAGLDDTREAEQVDNAAVAFEVMADVFDELVEAGVPSRSVEIKLADAQLTTTEPVTIRVTVTSVADPNESASYDIVSRPIVYDARSGTSLAYTSGAVVRMERDGMVMLHPPDFRLSSERTVLTVIQTRTDELQAVGGDHRVHVRAVRSEPKYLVAESTPHNVTIEIISPRAAAWWSYLSDNPDVTDCERPAPDTVRCSITTDRVYVVVVPADITFR